MTPRWIRYFACTDDSPLGRIALIYLKALCRIAPVGLVPLEVPLGPRWEPYFAGLRAPKVGTYVNVVCAPRSRWAWPQTVVVPPVDGKPGETHRGIIELHTVGVRNVLIAPVAPPTDHEREAAKTALKYDAVIVPPNMLEAWRSLRPDAHAMSEVSIIPDELRSLIVG